MLAMARPHPELVRAKRAEIARRYRRRTKWKPFMASLRIKDLRRLLSGRYPTGIPNDDAGRDFVTIMAHHLASLPRDPRRTIAAFIEEQAPWLSVGDQKQLILETIDKRQRWRADTLAWRLRLTAADRATLKITTIGAIDLTKEQRAARRKEQKRIYARKWRILTGRNR